MSEWNAARIAKLRRLVESAAAAKPGSYEQEQAIDRLDEAFDVPDLLSLLDELESVTRERDTLYASLEANNRTLMEHSARLEALAR